MGTTRPRNDFINFIADASKNPDLAQRFLRRKTALGVYRFFQKEGYRDIPYNDCGEILKARKGMEGKYIPKRGPICDGPIKGY
jgi:hypothetical protein